jgi:hypothetical protein
MRSASNFLTAIFSHANSSLEDQSFAQKWPAGMSHSWFAGPFLPIPLLVECRSLSAQHRRIVSDPAWLSSCNCPLLTGYIDWSLQSDLPIFVLDRDVHRGRLMTSRLSFPSSNKLHSLHCRSPLSSASFFLSLPLRVSFSQISFLVFEYETGWPIASGPTDTLLHESKWTCRQNYFVNPVPLWYSQAKCFSRAPPRCNPHRLRWWIRWNSQYVCNSFLYRLSNVIPVCA